MAGKLGPVSRLAVYREAFSSLPDRYLGADAGFDATYQVRLADIGRTWEVRCTTTVPAYARAARAARPT